MSIIKIKKDESNPEWDSMEIKQMRSTWSIDLCDDGDVEIVCHTEQNGSEVLFLTQEQLKQVIEFLQTKLK